MISLKDTFKKNSRSKTLIRPVLSFMPKKNTIIKNYKFESEAIHLAGLFHHLSNSLFGLHVFHPAILIFTSFLRFLWLPVWGHFSPLSHTVLLMPFTWIVMDGLKRTQGHALRVQRRKPIKFSDSGGGLHLYSLPLLLQGCLSFLQESSLDHMKTSASKRNSRRQNLSRKYLEHRFKPAYRMETDVC